LLTFIQGYFECIDGNRRCKVAELLGWATIKAIIKPMTDEEVYDEAFTVNNNRNGYTPLEEGRWFKILMEKFPEKYPNQRELAKHVGVNQSTVARRIKLYELETGQLEINACRVLGIHKGASEEQIKEAFERLAKKYCPDQNRKDPEAEQKFREVSEAYAVLKELIDSGINEAQLRTPC
jgi:ParB/RepB/Spo0J family partition protein